MKLNEFVALDKQLRKQGSSINEFVKETTGKNIFEADPGAGINLGGDAKKGQPFDQPAETGEAKKNATTKLDTKGGGGLARLNPKYAMRRRKLINNAKKYLKIGQTQILAKFIDKIMKSQEHTAAAAVAASKEGKTPQEVLDALKDSTKESRAVQKQQLAGLKKAVERVGQNFETRVNSIIDKSDLKEKSKLALKNYWIMLSQQVEQKIYSTIVKKQNEFVKGLVKDNPELTKVINSLSGSKNYIVELERIKQETEKAKKNVAQAEKDAESEGEGEAKPEERKLEKGKKYKYTKTGKDGKTIEGEVEIVEVLGDGQVKVKTAGKSDDTAWQLGKESAAKKIGEEIKDEATAEPVAEPETATA